MASGPGPTATPLLANTRNRYRAQYEFANGIVAAETYPTALQIALNNLCNFKCVYCSDHREGNTVPTNRLEGRSWDDLIAVIPHVDVLAFHGISEFFIDRNFFDLLQRCADAGSTLSLNTNGSVATPKHFDALAKYPGSIVINFSLDAATAETYKRIRGWDWERVLRNIRAYMEIFAARRARTWTSISFVITRSSVHEMAAFVELAASLGMKEVKFYRLHEYGSLAWTIEAPDGKPFDYREECTDHFKALHDVNVVAATAAANRLGLHLDIPAPYGATEPVSG